MKKMIMVKAINILLLIVPLGFSYGAMKAPVNWVSLETNEVSTNSQEVQEFGQYVDRIIDHQESVLDSVDPNSSSHFLGGWKISGYKTDLSISKSGIFGVGALKAKPAAELTWSKKSKAKFVEEDKDTAPIVVSLNEEMTEEEIKEELAPVVAMAIHSGKVKNEKKFRKNLFTKATEMHGLMKEVFNTSSYTYEVSRFRLNLSFGVSGQIFGIARLGGDFRVRLDWNKVSKPSSFIEAKTSKKSKLTKMINKLVKEVSLASEQYEANLPVYNVSAVSVGVGISHKGIWGIAKSKASSSGLLFFKKVKNPSSQFLSRSEIAENDKTELFLVVDEIKTNENPFIQDLSKYGLGIKKLKKLKIKKFRKGLKKAFKISRWLSKKAERKTKNWYISQIKVVFTLSYKAIFGLSSTSGSATTEIYLKK